MPYEEQVEQKIMEMMDVLKKYKNSLSQVNKEMKEQQIEFTGVCTAQQINGYRNKNEFSIGKNAQNEIVVGFRVGSYTDGSTEVCDLETGKLPHLPAAAKWAAKSFQDFIRANNDSELKLEPFNPETNSGHLKQLMVRTAARANEIMVVVGVHSSNLTAEQLTKLKAGLKHWYAEGNANKHAEFRCTSLYYQDAQNRKSGQMSNPVEHLAGTEHITDHILYLSIRISPLAFFQVNTAGANVLYGQIIKLAAPKAHSYVLDICCGTGTIGLAIARHCKRVLGVDIIEQAIADAEINAKANHITNVRFYAGNADDFVSSMAREAVYDCGPGEELDLIAVVDPPRNGLHSRSIAAIRAATEIKRLVYVSCHPLRAQSNWLDLCRPESKKYKGNPFRPIKAVGVDMFPHTTHTEMIMLFERDVPKAAADKQEDLPEQTT